MSSMLRTAARSILSMELMEGVGAYVRRSVGTQNLRNLDPFLMLDQFSVTPPAGLSDHPHRGFETVTYMVDGIMEHEDFIGNRDRLNAGDLQWMTAGKGIVHAEVPVDKEAIGLQLWVNLPSQHKLMEPRYQNLRGDELPIVQPNPGVTIKLIAGEAFGKKAKVHTLTPICYYDVHLTSNAQINIPIPSSYNGFLYLLRGSSYVGVNKLLANMYECVILDPLSTSTSTSTTNNDDLSYVPIVAGDSGTRFIFLGGEPIGEPIVQHGPFVMNSQDEIQQAIKDYRNGENGFEHAPTFHSEISGRVKRH